MRKQEREDEIGTWLCLRRCLFGSVKRGGWGGWGWRAVRYGRWRSRRVSSPGPGGGGGGGVCGCVFFFFRRKTAYEIGL